MGEARRSEKMGPNIASYFLTLSQRKNVLGMFIAVYCNGAYKSNSSDASLSPDTCSRPTEVTRKHECIWCAWQCQLNHAQACPRGELSEKLFARSYSCAQRRVLERAVPAQKTLVQKRCLRPHSSSPKTGKKQTQQHLLVWASPEEVAAWTTYKMAPTNLSELCSRARR